MTLMNQIECIGQNCIFAVTHNSINEICKDRLNQKIRKEALS